LWHHGSARKSFGMVRRSAIESLWGGIGWLGQLLEGGDETRRPLETRFLRRWIPATMAGEALGFTVAVAVAVVVIGNDMPMLIAFPLMVGAGAVEGALLGTGQAIALARLRLRRTLRRWPPVTSAADGL
jgi:hypothetical protein